MKYKSKIVLIYSRSRTFLNIFDTGDGGASCCILQYLNIVIKMEMINIVVNKESGCRTIYRLLHYHARIEPNLYEFSSKNTTFL